MMNRKPTVFIVDDSAVVRQVLTRVLTEAGLKVIGSALDPIFALQKMSHDWPDVIVLDVEMPRMDGITFLRRLMAERPTPVVLCSTLTEEGAQTTLEALRAGAVGFFTKAKLGVKDQLESRSAPLIDAIKAAVQVNPNCLRSVQQNSLSNASIIQRSMHLAMDKVVAIGASTGGTQALEVVMTALPPICPGILIVQHMPEKFTAAFATRLNKLCSIELREAQDNDKLFPGLALVAPGGRHMSLVRVGSQYAVRIKDGPPVNRHRPSVDVLYRSVAACAGANSLGIILTGMGDDGARGLLAMHSAGASTIAEDVTTCVVHGMPKEAVKLGAVDREIPLQEIASAIVAFGNKKAPMAQ